MAIETNDPIPQVHHRRWWKLNLWTKNTAIATAIISGLLYIAIFSFPKHVLFSYAAPTCTGELAIFPGVHRGVSTSTFKIEYRDGLSIGNFRLAATKVCFIPTLAPAQGVTSVASAPFGSWLFRSHYRLSLSAAPTVTDIQPQSKAFGQPLEFKLNQADAVFSYNVDLAGQTEACVVSSTQLKCGVDKLGLKQGSSYTLALDRNFNGHKTGTPQTVAITVLPAITVTGTSIKAGETVYSKPTSLDITLDKPVKSAGAILEENDGDKTTLITSHTAVDGAHAAITWDQELPRQKTFRVTLKTAAASDGSMIDTPYSISFQTSGGPKVTGVSIGSSGVAGDARAVVSFDQPLSPGTATATLASITGGSANITRQGTSQIVYALHDMPRCGAFSLAIASGAVSEAGVGGGASWSYASRISCRLTKTIGYSVKGRPILAYFYGTGTSTVLFTGGIHGSEPSASYLMQAWANYLDSNAYRLPAGRQIVIVPIVNPDGIATNTRYNANNVNLDRNFPTSDWIPDITAAGGVLIPHGGGTAPLSEPETRSMVALTSSLQVRAEISFHAQGSLVGANKIADSVALGTAYAQAVHYGTVFYNPEETFGYTLTGEYETWMGEHAGTPAILIELPTLSGHYFSKHQAELWNMANL